MKKQIPLKIQNVSKSYGPILAINNISLEVTQGEIHGFLGPNGAGKTTTLKCIMDFLRPDAGKIEVFGIDTVGNSSKTMVKVGFLPGEVDLFPDLTGQAYIELAMRLRGIRNYPADLIQRLDFNVTKKFKSYSTGNKQKLGIILALLHEPKLLLLDEPTNGLDPLLQSEFYKLIKALARSGSTILMSSHNLAEVEAVSDRVTILKDGSIAAVEDIDTLKKKRLYTVKVKFKGNFDIKKLLSSDIELLESYNKTVVLQVKEHVTKIIEKLNMSKVADLEISHSGLEQLFMEYYK